MKPPKSTFKTLKPSRKLNAHSPDVSKQQFDHPEDCGKSPILVGATNV
ncbi:MAG: hypothetical protein QW717_06095 [Candidatus Bathyarchaeia archaeon]